MANVPNREQTDSSATVEGTDIRVSEIGVAYDHCGYNPDEITQLYPDVTLGDVHRALAHYYDDRDDCAAVQSDWA